MRTEERGREGCVLKHDRRLEVWVSGKQPDLGTLGAWTWFFGTPNKVTL